MPIPPLRPRSLRTLHTTHQEKDKEGAPRKQKRKRPLWQYIVAVGIILVLLCGILGIGAFAYYSRDLPDPSKINDRAVAQNTRIFARDGKTILYEIHGDVSRTVIPLNDIPKFAQQATISIEDKNFYKNKGVSIRGIIRSIFLDVISGKKSQGGSTITQQFIKNAVLTNEKSISRKIKEIVLAYQMERKFSKDQILQLYFNEIPYGSNIYGIESASQRFFNKPAKDLTIDEAALLAAIPQAPTYYSPYGDHKDILVGRQQYILSLMQKFGYITQEQFDTAKAVDVMKKIGPSHEPIVAPHFVFFVREYLVEKYGDSMVERGGLQVTTTLDPELQKNAEQAISDSAEKNLKSYKASNEAIVSEDPKTGQILAMVGSKNYFDKTIDGNVNVATSIRNPGSSFKPFVYTAAFLKGYTPDTILYDLKTNFGSQGNGTDYVPSDYDGKERGPLPMRKALSGSLNIPAVKTLYLAGIPSVVDLAKKAGYTTFDTPDKYGLALALGGVGVKLYEHVAAFGMLANDGKYNPPVAIMKVEDNKGKILEQFTKKETEVIDVNTARMMQNLLSDDSARSYIFGAKSKLTLSDRQVAAKTGTTNDWRDGWTMGFTPSLVTGVWAGNNDYSPMAKGSDGIFVAAPIWNSFMKKALANTKPEKFASYKKPTTTKPVLTGDLSGESTVYVDKVTGLSIPASCLATYPQDFVQKSTYKEVHEILYYVDKDKPQGDPPSDPTKDPQFARWDAPVQAWAKKQNYTSTKPKEGSCDARATANLPVVTITSPAATDTISVRSTVVTVSVTGPQTLTRVDFYIDDALVGSALNGALTSTISLVGIESGFHTLKAVATDAIQNTGSTAIDVNLLFPS